MPPDAPAPSPPKPVVSKGLPTWKKSLIAVGLIVMLAGLVMRLAAPGAGKAGGAGALGVTSLVTGGTGTDAQATPSPMRDVWSPALFRFGLGFVLAFALGIALRSFFRVTLVFLALYALSLWGLQYAGVLQINWTLLESRSQEAGAWLSSQVRTFEAFIAGYLPSGGAAAAGLALGFKKG